MFMDEFHYEQDHLVKLTCGCLLHEGSGELHEECLPHGQAYFMQ